MYAVCVVLKLEPGTRDVFMPMVLKNAKTSLQNEFDCRRFDVASDTADPDTVFLYELYTDRAGFDAHLKTDHFTDFDSAAAPMIADKTIVTWDTVVS